MNNHNKLERLPMTSLYSLFLKFVDEARKAGKPFYVL